MTFETTGVVDRLSLGAVPRCIDRALDLFVAGSKIDASGGQWGQAL
jgi:hypothetical protein